MTATGMFLHIFLLVAVFMEPVTVHSYLIYSFFCAGNSKISQDEIRHGWVAKLGGQSKSGFNMYFLAASTIPLAVIGNAKSKCADFGGASIFLIVSSHFLF